MIPWSDDIYISGVKSSCCILCGEFEDLRCGVCWNCSNYVTGQKIEGGHELWDKRNPSIRWKVDEKNRVIG